jgi:hypothetical protein
MGYCRASWAEGASLLVAQESQCRNQPRACLAEGDDIVNLTCCGSWVGACEFLAIFVHQACSLGLRFGFRHALEFLAVQDIHCTFRTHHGDFGRRPSERKVGARQLACHHDVGSAIGFARHNADLGNGSFGVSIDDFGPCRIMPPCS